MDNRIVPSGISNSWGSLTIAGIIAISIALDEWSKNDKGN